MKRQLIKTTQERLVVCDNINCDYEVPYTEEEDKNLVLYVNMPCLKCRENLLTEEDYNIYIKTMNSVNFLNKYFSWITFFFPKSMKEKISIASFKNRKVNTEEQ